MAIEHNSSSKYNEPTDNLILTIIKDHARKHPDEEKVMLTGNSRDFDSPEIRETLSHVGINTFFPRTEAFLGWFRSRRNTDTI